VIALFHPVRISFAAVRVQQLGRNGANTIPH